MPQNPRKQSKQGSRCIAKKSNKEKSKDVVTSNETKSTSGRQHDNVLRGSCLDELVVTVGNVLSPQECRRVESCHVGCKAMGETHDRQETLSFAHECWRIEEPLRENNREIYDKLIGRLMQDVDAHYWQKLQLAHDEHGQLRIAGECKKNKEQVQIRPEVEYIVYDADEAVHTGQRLPHIGPHTDNSSVVTMVCLLSNPSEFEGGVNYFCPERLNGEPREYKLKQGEAVLFRGESCMHWITDVQSGRRAILQIELALCSGKHDTPISSSQVNAGGKSQKRGRK